MPVRPAISVPVNIFWLDLTLTTPVPLTIRLIPNASKVRGHVHGGSPLTGGSIDSRRKNPSR
jgi:hypothetical protein